MSIVLPLLLLVLIVSITVRHMSEGLWGGFIHLVNTVTAALIATALFEPMANWLESLLPEMHYVADIISCWIPFTLAMLVMMQLTGSASRYIVKFPKLVDQVGGVVFSAWAGWVLVCFTLMTLHTAPLARESFLGGLQSEQPMFFGLAYPDRLWLSFAHQASTGPYYAGEAHEFDPEGKFLFRYTAKRARFETEEGLFVRGPRK